MHALADPRAVSLYAETGEDFVKNLATDCGHVVVKAHRLDRTFVALANVAGVKVILTDRDPLDSVVSQRERFGHSMLTTVRNICRSYAAMAARGPGVATPAPDGGGALPLRWTRKLRCRLASLASA